MLVLAVDLIIPHGGQISFTSSIPHTSAVAPALQTPRLSDSGSSSLTDNILIPSDQPYPTECPTCHYNKVPQRPEVFVEVQDASRSSVAGTNPSSTADMKQIKTKATIGILSTIITYMSLNSIYKSTHPQAFVWQEEDLEEASWIATSRSWLDRKACRWVGVCGGHHMHFTRHAVRPGLPQTVIQDAEWDHQTWEWQNPDAETIDRPEDWSMEEQLLREIPEYVLDYAPLVHLFSGEQYWPSDMAEHLEHVTPALNYTPIQSRSTHARLDNLAELNQYQRGRFVFLTSNDNVEERPAWLTSEKNIPSLPSSMKDDFSGNDGWIHHPGKTYLKGLQDSVENIKEWFGAGHTFDSEEDLRESATATRAQAKLLQESAKKFHMELKRQLDVQLDLGDDDPDVPRVRGGRSDAPAVLIVINKGHGVVDAFWFFFYSFNLGNTVFNVRFGNHIGDWEHTAIRFHHGEPKAVFFSEHNFGSVYSYDAVEKIGKRPVIYSAVGTHAMYATPGLHPYVLPWGILHDQTDRGPLWDPALNSHTFTYDFKKDILRASNLTPKSPTSWFHFAGHWGDKFYPLGDKRQYRFAGQYHYVNGPLGPKFKNLGRKKICGGPESQPCVIKHWLSEEIKITRLQPKGVEADLYTAQAEDLGTRG